MKLIIDNAIPFIKGEAEKLGETVYKCGADITATDVRDADVLIVRTRTRCDRALLEGSKVRLVVTATIGFDHIDTTWLAEAGIRWTNCPGCNAASVGQYVACCLLRLQQEKMLEVRSLTIGVVGVGHVGTEVVAAVERLGCRVLQCDPFRAEAGEESFVELKTIAEQADVVTFHTPLTTDGPYPTHHLANADFFSACRAKQPLIIHAARGGVVDEQALLAAIDHKHVRGVIIDTWEHEPQIDQRLLEKAIFATPHIAGYSADGKTNGTRMSLQAVADFFGLDIAFNILPPALPANYRYNPFEQPACEQLRRYDPLVDSMSLKKYPMLFEQLRGNYPLRRECSF